MKKNSTSSSTSSSSAVTPATAAQLNNNPKKRVAESQAQPEVSQFAKNGILRVPPACSLPTEDEGMDLNDFERVWKDLNKETSYDISNEGVEEWENYYDVANEDDIGEDGIVEDTIVVHNTDEDDGESWIGYEDTENRNIIEDRTNRLNVVMARGSINAEKFWVTRKKDDIERDACYYRDIYEFNPEMVPIHQMETLYQNICPHCGAFYALEECNREKEYTLCCNNGKCVIKPFQTSIDNPLHVLIANLLDYKHPMSKEFIKDIRKINTVLSFAAPILKEKDIAANHVGPPVVIVQGNITHLLGPVLNTTTNSNEKIPHFMQAYFYEPIPDQQLSDYFKLPVPVLDLIHEIRNLIKETNGFYKSVRMAYEEFCDLPENQKQYYRTIIVDKSSNSQQIPGIANGPSRVYNAPETLEVAMLSDYATDSVAEKKTKCVQIYWKARPGKALEALEYYKAPYLPLSYPLLYLFGESGWHWEFEGRKSKTERVTLRDYCSFICQIRDSITGPIQHDLVVSAQRLFQQFACDLFSCVESSRLDYVRQNQGKLKADSYSSIKKRVERQSGENGGRYYILPSSFLGSLRWYQQQYLDAMSRVSKFGVPDLFITMTCNPKWREIQESLRMSQQNNKVPVSERPDIVARVFEVKKEDMLKLLKEKRVFGEVLAYQAVVEYQKRGLPHVHILIWLSSKDKPKTVDDYDRFCSAEIPDDKTHPELFELVKTHMIHGPCGALNPNCPCMVEGRCKSRFPKRYCERTTQITGCFPELRRRSPTMGGRTLWIKRRGTDNVEMTNQWVVPYNPYLLTRYQCHINVEIVNNLRVIKYLYKYIYKGTSKAITSQRREYTNSSGQYIYDETKSYKTFRYFGAVEALSRIYTFQISKSWPPVKRLSIHLEGDQSVTYDEEDDEEEALNRANHKGTQLLAFFQAVKEEKANPLTNEQRLYQGSILPQAIELTYSEFPTYFTEDTSGGKIKWKRTRSGKAFKRNPTISRLPFIAPTTNSDLFFLRILLLKVKGPTCFQDLKIYEGNMYPTFKEACIARGLFHDDQEWFRCLDEAILADTNVSRIRYLFAIILFYNEPAQPRELWEKFKDNLSEDFRYNRTRIPGGLVVEDIDRDAALIAIHKILLELSGGAKGLQNYGINLPVNVTYTDILFEATQMNEVEVIQEQELLENNIASMNPDQLQVFNELKLAAEEINTGRCFFIDAPGGTGKTFLLNTLIRYLNLKQVSCIASAFSGIAATLLINGKTTHTWFKLPLHTIPPVTCNVDITSKHAKLLKLAKVIIIDEAPMLHRLQLEAIHNLLNEIEEIKPNNMESLFGGKTIILAGDFRQTLPVMPKESRAGIIEALINRSYVWKRFQTLQLTINERVLRTSQTLSSQQQQECRDFANWVLQIGNGSIPSPITIPSRYMFVRNSTLQSLVSWVYPEFRNKGILQSNEPKACEKAILCATNAEADEINDLAVSEMEEVSSYTLLSADRKIDTAGAGGPEDWYVGPSITGEILNSINVPGYPPHKLILKPGTPLILLRNLHIGQGLCNGTKLEFKRIHKHYLMEANIAGSTQTVLLPRIKFTIDKANLSFEFIRLQFPVKAAFGMTINKSQGQSLKKVAVFLPRAVFSHGQLYVALSRSSNPASTKVFIKEESKHKTEGSTCHFITATGEGCTKNEVWKECFQPNL